MLKFLIFFLFSCLPLLALRIDPHSQNFSEREKKKNNQYDFQGEYPALKNIEIDARRKMDVEVDLSGNYPLLEKINIEGGFGTISGNMRGHFPRLKEIALTCTKATLDWDLEGHFGKECAITIRCQGASTIRLPQTRGCHVTVISSPFGKVENLHPYLIKRKTKWGTSFQRIFMTPKDNQEPPLKITIFSDRDLVRLQ